MTLSYFKIEILAKGDLLFQLGRKGLSRSMPPAATVHAGINVVTRSNSKPFQNKHLPLKDIQFLI